MPPYSAIGFRGKFFLRCPPPRPVFGLPFLSLFFRFPCCFLGKEFPCLLSFFPLLFKDFGCSVGLKPFLGGGFPCVLPKNKEGQRIVIKCHDRCHDQIRPTFVRPLLALRPWAMLHYPLPQKCYLRTITLKYHRGQNDHWGRKRYPINSKQI